MEQDLAAPPPGGLLTETCLSGLPVPGHDLLDRGPVSLSGDVTGPGPGDVLMSVPAGGPTQNGTCEERKRARL